MSSTLTAQAIVSYGAPLQALQREIPAPSGTEVLLRVHRCGVCHSDVHLQDGYFDLGGDKRLDIGGSHRLPLIPGHEIQGTVVALGPEATGVAVGDARVAYPWIGCGTCPTCSRGEEHLCGGRPRCLGINVDGGYGDHVLVPHPRYLLDHTGIDPALAAICMCSGLTAHSALSRAAPLTDGEILAIVGLGGVGMMGLQLARARFPGARLLALDVNDAKLDTARDHGADAVCRADDPQALKQCLKDTGGVLAAVDFVGSEASLAAANRLVRKGGRVVIVGLFGGKFSMAIPLFPLRAVSLMGSYVGSLAEARELLALVARGGIAPIPMESRPLDAAGATLDDLRAGKVLGRVVLDCGAV